MSVLCGIFTEVPLSSFLTCQEKFILKFGQVTLNRLSSAHHIKALSSTSLKTFSTLSPAFSAAQRFIPHPALQRTAVSKCNFSSTPRWKKVINADNADGWIKPVLSSCRLVILNHMILSLILQSFGDRREERREELMYFGHGGVCSHIISVMNRALFVFVKLRPQQLWLPECVCLCESN